jgi:hypothetical protein
VAGTEPIVEPAGRAKVRIASKIGEASKFGGRADADVAYWEGVERN